jgi:5'-nucleotidase
MIILATNDDGVYSPGLSVLAKAVEGFGEVYVVAPDREQSAVAHSVTLYRPLLVEKIRERVYAVNGTPTDCVLLAGTKLLPEKPALVISGINKGGNLGEDILYSGTVSAAMEGALMGIPSIAFSMVARENFKFNTTVPFIRNICERVMREGLPDGNYLNINFPNVMPDALKGVRVTKQGRRAYVGSVLERIDPRGNKYYWLGGETENWHDDETADHQAVKDGYISVTPLRIDVTEHALTGDVDRYDGMQR